jgi:hypothetical protein
MNYGQSVTHYCLVFSIYRGAKTNEDRVEIKVWFSIHSSDEIVENGKLPLKRLPHFWITFFTTVFLSTALYKLGTFITGTIRRNRKYSPQTFRTNFKLEKRNISGKVQYLP